MAGISASVTKASPPRPTDEATHNSYRLLYRGSLSLPDSHLLLDGLTFMARLTSPSKNNHLLQSPLALALESMRGRQSLRLIGVINLHDKSLHLDESGAVEIDIHPKATLTRIYFENLFCLTPSTLIPQSDSSTLPNTSNIGIKVALGDSDGPETTQAVIFTRQFNTGTLDLIVARLTALPSSTHASSFHLPRPDDPTPRKPPAFYAVDDHLTNKPKTDFKRAPSIWELPARESKRASGSIIGTKVRKLNPLDVAVAADLGSGLRLRDEKVRGKGTGLFKVPDLPPSSLKRKGKGKDIENNVDVFGKMGKRIQSLPEPGSKGKRKRGIDQEEPIDGEAADIENTNRDAIKRCTLDHLYKFKDPTVAKINKTHPEFKELFNRISKGVAYALRAHMKVRPVDSKLVSKFVQIHMSMYLGDRDLPTSNKADKTNRSTDPAP